MDIGVQMDEQIDVLYREMGRKPEGQTYTWADRKMGARTDGQMDRHSN
jgi:hypothetical protein